VRCVLFDLDGTLVDTWWLYVEAYRRTLAPHFGRPLTMEDLRVLRPTSEIRLLHNAVGAEAAPAYHRAFIEHYGRLHAERCEGVYPGVPELLATLRGEERRLGLVTGKSRPAWEITAAHCALGPFEAVVTDEDVQRPKPDPAGLQLALAQLGVAPRDSLYVGDSLDDLGAAHATGMAFAGVLWCKAPGEREAFAAAARERGALACLETPQALLTLLESAEAEVVAPRRAGAC